MKNITAILDNLSADDDPQLWESAIATVCEDAKILAKSNRSKRQIFAQIGRCSHWMSPHNKGTSIRDVEKFAWASGYGSKGFTILGLPEFDWSVAWKWNEVAADWETVEIVPGGRLLLFRVAIPGRTARHARAVVHTLWTPGSPTIPNSKFLQAYGFKRMRGVWKFVATSPSEMPYQAAEPLDASE